MVDFLDKDVRLDNNMILLVCYIEELFQKNEKLTLSQIKYLLEKSNISYNDSVLLYAIKYLFINKGVIVRNDFWGKEADYFKVDEYRQCSSYSKHYYSFEIDDCNLNKFLLISDTHIGDESLEDFLLIDKIYDYAIKCGVKRCFHLGDLFAGQINSGDFNLWDKLQQIKKFYNSYPKPLPSEIVTYAIQGNHDEQIDDVLWHDGFSSYYYDLRELTFLNPSFYMFSRNFIKTQFSNIGVSFSHRFYHNTFCRRLRVTCLEDLINKNYLLDEKYDVHISGHLHKGLIYGVGESMVLQNNEIYLGVPSTSKLNINGVVAYLVTINYNYQNDVTSMDVTTLNCDGNYIISNGDSFSWKFNQNNDVYKKIYR